ncbi:MAG: C-GCAxxG-C-C family protein [Deltaproteobacteria bacterium]|nr:C-GCAxxG-C-C family protein [Deltaproteobacteria bacterium]
MALQKQFGLENGAIIKALTAFPGGIALRGETCGVVIGCIMALGLVYGREKMDDLQGYFDVLPKAGEFCHRFAKELGGTTCRDIAKSDLRKWYNQEELHEAWKLREVSGIKHRAKVVGKGVQIAAEIILKKTTRP